MIVDILQFVIIVLKPLWFSRSVRNSDDTGVDTLCSYKNNPSVAKFNKVEIYHELKSKTKGVTKLGIYTLEKNSLYVDGKHMPRTSEVAHG